MNTIVVPNEILNAHECEALVIRCMDFRYRKPSMQFLEVTMGITYDLITIPGALKGLANEDPKIAEFTKLVVSTASELHHIQKVLTIHHATCGAYGISDPEEEFKKQSQDIRRGTEILSSLFPALSFTSFFAKRGDGIVEYVKID